ncbi:MAG: hypothetical protein FWF12_04040 [Betaproteobacteria bacterium]|nr:hypothetical protein [Betaproteobacteria bacterium]
MNVFSGLLAYIDFVSIIVAILFIGGGLVSVLFIQKGINIILGVLLADSIQFDRDAYEEIDKSLKEYRKGNPNNYSLFDYEEGMVAKRRLKKRFLDYRRRGWM